MSLCFHINRKCPFAVILSGCPFAFISTEDMSLCFHINRRYVTLLSYQQKICFHLKTKIKSSSYTTLTFITPTTKWRLKTKWRLTTKWGLTTKCNTAIPHSQNLIQYRTKQLLHHKVIQSFTCCGLHVLTFIYLILHFPITYSLLLKVASHWYQ